MEIIRRISRRCTGYGDPQGDRQTPTIHLFILIAVVIRLLVLTGETELTVSIFHAILTAISKTTPTEPHQLNEMILRVSVAVSVSVLGLLSRLLLVVLFLVPASARGLPGLLGLGLLWTLGRRGRRNPVVWKSGCTGGDGKPCHVVPEET